MIIKTKLDIEHLELIKIFLKANELVGVVITEELWEVNGRFHMVLQLESTCDLTSTAITFLGIRHSGVLNMFDDYLIKCGVPVDALQPKSYHRQMQEERESEVTEDFMLRFMAIKGQNANINP
jgi:hypothetical protein